MLISSVLISFSIKAGHTGGDDFALYINQSKSLLNLSLDQLYEANKFSVENSSAKYRGPYLVPNGFPILLSPIYYFFGIDFIKMKILCALFFVLSIPLLFLLFKVYFSNYTYPLLITFSIAFNFFYIYFTDYILSDLPFFFFCMLTLYLLNLKNSIINQILIGICIFFTYSIRDIGICLLPTLFIYQIIYFKKYLSHPFYLSIPYFIFFSCFILIRQLVPSGSESHLEMLISALSFNLVFDNILYYIKLIARHFLFYQSLVLGGGIVVLSLLGICYKWKRNLHFTVFICCSMFILIIWPAKEGCRFLFPIFPLVTFFIINGILLITTKLKQNKKRILFLLKCYFLLYFIASFYKVSSLVNKDTSDNVYSIEMQEIYSYISSTIAPHEIMAYKKPRALFLFTNIPSIGTNANDFEQSVARYFLIKKNSAIRQLLDKYKLKKEFPNYLILEKTF